MFHQVPSLRAQTWIALHHDIYSVCSEQTGNKLKLQSLNPTQHWSCWRPWGCPTPARGSQEVNPASTCLGIWSSKGCHASTCLGIHQSRGPRRSSRLDVPRDPILRRLTCLNMPGDLISRRLSGLSLPGDPHPDPGTPGSQVATELSRIRFKKTHHPWKLKETY